MSPQCRTCLSTNSETYIEMSTTTANGQYTYMECFQKCTQLPTDDELQHQLPTTICAVCAHDLQVAYGFVEAARQADSDLRSSFGAKLLETEVEEPEMERLEMLEESDEAENEESLLEELVGPSDAADNKLEYMEVETIEEEHIIEDCMEEVPLSPHYDEIEEKPQLADNAETEMNREGEPLANLEENRCTIKEEQVPTTLAETTANIDNVVAEACAEDELDDEYLIEYIDVQLEKTSTTTSPNSTKWKCVVCKRVLRGDVVYEGHMNMHQKLRPYKCEQCPAAFRCRNALERHEKRRHDTLALHQQQQQLVEEHSSCNSNETEPEHVNENDNEVKETNTALWSCDLCKRQLHSEAALRVHQKTHLSERTYECSECAKRFANAYTLRTHMRNLHSPQATENTEKESDRDVTETGDTVVQCELCKKQLLQQNYAKHAAMHARKQQQQQPKAAAKDATEPEKFLCAHCPRECKNRKLLYQHEKIHEGESPGIIYICADCERQYATVHLLEQHRKQAHKERDNICPICGNAFKLKNQLVNHMKLHLEKNIQCPQCEKRYARQFDLNVHLRTHTGELPFACHLCEKRFAIKVRLTYHLQKHLGVKHCCKECGAEFNSKQKLKAHSFKHSGMPYRCEMCNDHGFANRDVFKRHLMRVHHASMSDEALVEMFQRNTGKTTRIRPIDEMKHVVVHTYEMSADAPTEDEERLINDEDIAMESEVVHT